jgi:hypothetical protein
MHLIAKTMSPMNSKVLVVTISVLALLLVSTSFTFGAFATSSSTANTQKIYPRGTICGDAQLGKSVASQFNGHSNFQRFYSLFTVNNMILSGGDKGTITSSSGSLSVYNHKGGELLLYATYEGMKGTYKISGSSMYLTGFTASKIHVYFNHIKDHNNDHMVEGGTYSNAHVPNQVLSCTTQDALISYYP